MSGVTRASALPQVDVTNTAVIGSVTPDPNLANNTSTSLTAATFPSMFTVRLLT